MAPPTTVKTLEPNFGLSVIGTNIDAGNNDYVLSYNGKALSNGFSIVTGTLTNMAVNVLADNNNNVADITYDLFGVTMLASSTAYIVDIPTTSERVIIRVARTNATNAVDLEIFAPRR